MEQNATDTVVLGITRAIEYLTSSLRTRVGGGDPAKELAWAREQIENLLPAFQKKPCGFAATDDFKSVTPKGWNTVLGYLAVEQPAMLALMEEPVSDTVRDGCWLVHRCRELHIEPIKVPAPAIARAQGITEVNAYPVSLLERRLG
jgi:hypothetical protein